MQVDPIKPTLKAPGTKRLKQEQDEPLSSSAFNFNLRRYSVGAAAYAPPPPPPPAGQNLSDSAFNASAPPGANAAALSLLPFDSLETMELEQALRRWEEGREGGQAYPVAAVSAVAAAEIAAAAAAAAVAVDRGGAVQVEPMTPVL